MNKNLKKYALIGLCSLYVCSPIDLMPDFILVAGWLDDLAVIGVTLNALAPQFSELFESQEIKLVRRGLEALKAKLNPPKEIIVYEPVKDTVKT